MPPNDYAVLMYDIPSSSLQLYHKLYAAVHRRALKLNRSVMLVKWSMKDELLNLVKDLETETSQKADVKIIKFDPSSDQELEQASRDALTKQLKAIDKTLTSSIKRLQTRLATGKIDTIVAEKRRGILLSKAKRDLADAEGVSLLFSLSGQTDAVFRSVKKRLSAELQTRLLDASHNLPKKESA